MVYIVYKKINGKTYAYAQETWREGKHVRTKSTYIGSADGAGGTITPSAKADMAALREIGFDTRAKISATLRKPKHTATKPPTKPAPKPRKDPHRVLPLQKQASLRQPLAIRVNTGYLKISERSLNAQHKRHTASLTAIGVPADKDPSDCYHP